MSVCKNDIALNRNITITNTHSWNDINWKIVNKSVKRLRSRIFTSVKNGDNKLTKQLQRLLVKSDSNILFSIRKVTLANTGGKTVGVDNLKYINPSQRMELFYEIKSIDYSSYEPLPVRRKYVPKPNSDKLRPLGIPTIKDRVIQQVILNALEPQWEFHFEAVSYGFRPKRQVNDCINRIFLALSKENSRSWIVDADISLCFDKIEHKYLLDKIKGFPFHSLIEKWLTCGVMENGVKAESSEGTPQGGVISPLLSNIALHGLESELGVHFHVVEKGYIKAGSRLYLRFADDIIIITYSRNDAELAKQDLELALKKRGLTLNQGKTAIRHITSGFDFLGFTIRILPQDIYKDDPLAITYIDEDTIHYDHSKTLLIIKPSKKGLQKLKSKVKEIFRISLGKPVSFFINKLNPVIRGFCISKQAWHCNRTFHILNNYFYNITRTWAHRRHTKKGVKWIISKYYFHYKKFGFNNRWVFSDPKNRNCMLLQPGWFKPQRHILIQNMARPDDKSYLEYFENLEQQRFEQKNISFYSKLNMLLATQQKLKCLVCESSLFDIERLHRHHIIEKSLGGPNTSTNLVLLHEACHYRITYGSDETLWREKFTNFKKLYPINKVEISDPTVIE